MRRKDREITDSEEILDIINRCEVMRVGMVDEDGYCYMVPVNFGAELRDGRCALYFHSALEGKKISILRKNPKVSFEMDTGHGLLTGEQCADYSYRYLCVMGKGRVSFVEEAQEKIRALDCLMKRFTGREGWAAGSKALDRVHALRLDIEEWSAKKNERQ